MRAEAQRVDAAKLAGLAGRFGRNEIDLGDDVLRWMKTCAAAGVLGLAIGGMTACTGVQRQSPPLPAANAAPAPHPAVPAPPTAPLPQPAPSTTTRTVTVPEQPKAESPESQTRQGTGDASVGCFASYATTQSTVALCRDASGDVTYHGTSSSGSITLPAHATSNGYETSPNNGITYTINSSHLVIEQNGSVIADQAVVGSGSGWGRSSNSPGRSSSGSSGYSNGLKGYQQCGVRCGQEPDSADIQQQYLCEQGILPKSQC